jgi:hypothetical protein
VAACLPVGPYHLCPHLCYGRFQFEAFIQERVDYILEKFKNLLVDGRGAEESLRRGGASVSE